MAMIALAIDVSLMLSVDAALLKVVDAGPAGLEPEPC